MSVTELVVGVVLIALAFAAGFVKGRSSRAGLATPVPGPTPRGGDTAPVSLARSPAEPAPPARRSRASAPRRAPAPLAPPPPVTSVRSWGYQLQDLDVKRAAASRFDLLVVDYAKDGTDDTALKPAEIARLQTKPDGSRRLVLAYISIGEAESYRFYWRREWSRQRPGWLLRENPDWDQNYAVRFWDPGWQALLFGRPGAYLDKILAQGFDGIYLDKCDVAEDLHRRESKAVAARTDLDGDMIALVRKLAGYGRRKRPGFLVVAQNAEPLLERAELRREIDAVAKEELFFGLDAAETANDPDEIEWSRERLDLSRKDGKPVLVVEYLDDAAKIAQAAKAAHDLGYVLYVAGKDRELDSLRNDLPVA